MRNSKLHREILQRQDLLVVAKKTLKQEFFGIDNVIDEVVDAASSWFLFPDMQERPVVINLWGLTGVGKSSLVNRLAHLLRFEKRYYHFDLGDRNSSGWTVMSKMEEICDNMNGYPVLIALDEFQHARTLDESGSELYSSSSRIIWQLLDSGKFQISRSTFRIDEIGDLTQRLRYLLNNGVTVVNGRVVSNAPYFIEQMELQSEIERHFTRTEFSKQSDTPLFIPTSFYDAIYSMAREEFSSMIDMKRKLLTLNGQQTIRFLNHIFAVGNSPRLIDCSKGLVFVLGNLDEAYTMSCDFNPDMDADEFHEQSLKINLPAIKRALKVRFRNEQIARLGNTHIIYPAFNQMSFRKIIAQELTGIADKVGRRHGLELQFDPSMHDFIYYEGVYPTQGTRPLFTTIHAVINAKLGRVITEMIINETDPTRVVLSIKEGEFIAQYYRNDNLVHSLSLHHQSSLENLRVSRRDDLQAVTAVHEAGHAILSAALLNTLPEIVNSNSAETGGGGFIYTKVRWKYVARKEITGRTAMMLGGMVAERLVFGDENVTTGAEDDIGKATRFVTEMLKQYGMGELPVAYHTEHPDTRSYVYDNNRKLCREAELFIAKAVTMAEKTLREEERLLLKMADYLSDNRQMKKEQIKSIILKYARNINLATMVENGDSLFYRQHLKGEVAASDKEADRMPLATTVNILLNRTAHK